MNLNKKPLTKKTYHQTILELESYDLDTLISIKSQLDLFISRKQKLKQDKLDQLPRLNRTDNRIEEAIVYLAGRCDGAGAEDGQGFNKPDSKIGKFFARLIEKDPGLFTYPMAEKALNLLKKYQKSQLQHIKLPTWEEVARQYGDPIALSLPETKKDHILYLSGKRICAKFPYDRDLVDVCRSIEGRKFDGNIKQWDFPLSSYEQIKENFPSDTWEWDDHIEAGYLALQQKKAEKQHKLEQKAIKDAEKINDLIATVDLDAPLDNGWKLREYQKDGVKFLLSNSKEAGLYDGAILADDQGVGKTVQALIAAKALQLKTDCIVFVICPLSLTLNWQKEASLLGVRIETYSNHHQSIPLPLENKPYIVICDEAHAFQNKKSKRTSSIANLISTKNCLASWFLTATPLKNGRPLNLLPLLSFVKHPVADKDWDYKQRYCNAKKTAFGWNFNGASHLDELSKKIADVMLRRTKKQVLKELPEKTTVLNSVVLTQKKTSEYNKKINNLVNDYIARCEAGENDISAEALVTLGYIRKESSNIKVESTIELAQSLLDGGKQVVIFTDFVNSAKEIHAALGGELLTGESSPEERQASVDYFQAGVSDVFVSTIKSGGVGITLTAASELIMHDRTWTPGDVYQACDRIYRIGQKNACTIYWQQYTDDVDLDRLIADKQVRIDKVLAGKAKTMRGLGKSNSDVAKEILDRKLAKLKK